jgi:hypothetical protein
VSAGKGRSASGAIADVRYLKGHPMTRIRNSFGLLLLIILICVIPSANDFSAQDPHEQFWKVIQSVQDILVGRNIEKASATIAPSARLIQGMKYEYLRSVVAGEINTCSLADTSFHGVGIEAKTNPSEDMGLIVFKTRKSDTTKVRYHSVVIMKDSTGEFKIIAWHAGEGGQ